jgi:hypothetical protein
MKNTVHSTGKLTLRVMWYSLTLNLNHNNQITTKIIAVTNNNMITVLGLIVTKSIFGIPHRSTYFLQ